MDIPLLRLLHPQPIAIIPNHLLAWQVSRLAFLEVHEAAVVRVVLEGSYARLTQVAELHLLHVHPGHALRAVALDGDTEVRLVENAAEPLMSYIVGTGNFPLTGSFFIFVGWAARMTNT